MKINVDEVTREAVAFLAELVKRAHWLELQPECGTLDGAAFLDAFAEFMTPPEHTGGRHLGARLRLATRLAAAMVPLELAIAERRPKP